MLGNTDDIRKKTEEYNKNGASYGGAAGRLSYEAIQTRTSLILTRLAIGTAVCLFLGTFGILCAILMFNLVSDNHSLYQRESSLPDAAVSTVKSDSGSIFENNSENISVIRNSAAVENVTKEQAERYRVPTGVMVHELAEYGSLYEAGVIQGDIIVEFDSVAITDAQQLGELISDSQQKTVCLCVYRKGEYVKLYASFD